MPERSTLTSRLQRSGRRSAALLFVVAAVALAGFGATQHVQANPSQLIGVDMAPQSTGTTGASGVDTCTEIQPGAEFDADVFATNVDSLTAFELRVDFDPEILSLESATYDYLLTKDGGSPMFPQFFEEKTGRWFIGAADTSSPDSGSGTLARLHFKGLKKGTSSISIASNPFYYRPILTGALGVPVGDSNGDGYWDGDLSSGTVTVGASCGQSTPLVTPPPTHVPNPTPRPSPGGATPSPVGQTPGPEDTSEPAASSGSNGSGSDPGTEPSQSSGPIVGNIGEGGGSSGPTARPGGVVDTDDDTENGGNSPNQDASGGNGSSSTLIILIAVTLGLAAAGGVMLVLRRALARGPQ